MVIGVSGVAQAQEPFTWTGFYIGANVGYVWGDVDEPGIFPGEIDPEGFFLGGQVGYDYQLDNNIVLGLFVTGPVLFADEEESAFGLTFEADLDWAIAGGVRAGYAFGSFLPYVMGGYIVGEGTGTAPGFDLTETHDGYLLGLGLDYRISEMFDVGVTYTYTDMSEEEYEFATPVDVGFEADAISLKADFRF
jgi:outer membrane immunogenic protein